MSKRKRKNVEKARTTTTPGRPEGAKTLPAVTIDVAGGRCPRCGGTSVSWSAKPLEKLICGQSTAGVSYNAIRWTRKRCKCGQVRIEREYLSKSGDLVQI